MYHCLRVTNEVNPPPAKSSRVESSRVESKLLPIKCFNHLSSSSSPFFTTYFFKCKSRLLIRVRASLSDSSTYRSHPNVVGASPSAFFPSLYYITKFISLKCFKPSASPNAMSGGMLLPPSPR